MLQFVSGASFRRKQFFLHLISVINRRGCAPDDDGSVCAALAHDGHPCSCGHLHCLCDIRNDDHQNVPCDRMKNQHPPGITCLSGNQHHKMYPDHKHHRKIHRKDRNKHIVLISTDRLECSLRSDTRSQIRGKPRQCRRPEMDRQSYRNGEYPAQVLD